MHADRLDSERDAPRERIPFDFLDAMKHVYYQLTRGCERTVDLHVGTTVIVRVASRVRSDQYERLDL